LLVNRSSHAVKLLQAQERQQREAANAARQAREEAEKSEDQKEEEAVQKARAWDDFKDDHPTGYGNSKLRPCAL
jgi:immunoglobulin-binding protein 1